MKAETGRRSARSVVAEARAFGRGLDDICAKVEGVHETGFCEKEEVDKRRWAGRQRDRRGACPTQILPKTAEFAVRKGRLLLNKMCMGKAGKNDGLYATRRSLLSRVKNPEDQESWKVFFDTYSKLVYSVAAKAGLDHSEAEEVVQETFIALMKAMPNFKYDPAIGSFNSWLIHTTQFKIGDQLRKRKRRQPLNDPGSRHEGRTATIERIADPKSLNFESIFEDEWREKIVEMAVAKVKEQVPASQFQIFDLYVIKKWPVRKVASTLGISSGRVYLAKHRLTSLVKREVKALETEAI